MVRQPDYVHGVVQERGLTILIHKETFVPFNITGRNKGGKIVGLHDWETSVPVDEVSLSGVARAYGFADVEAFLGEVQSRGLNIQS